MAEKVALGLDSISGIVRQTGRPIGCPLIFLNDNTKHLQIFQDFAGNHPLGGYILHSLSSQLPPS